MKKFGFVGMIMIAVLAVLGTMVFTPGCSSTAPQWNQEEANAVAQTLGAGAVVAFNAKGDKLTPQEKQAATAAIAVFSSLGAGGVPTQDMINKAIADKIKDPAITQQAQTLAASFMAIINPQINSAISKAGASAGGQIFLSFCKGLASVPVAK
jgi:hypothetical protein